MMMRVLAAYLPSTRSGRILASAATVDSIGSGLFLALMPVFVVTRLGVDPVQVGILLGGANLLGLLSPLPAGWLSDRFGPGRVWSVLLAGRVLGYGAFLLVETYGQFAVLICLVSLLDRGSTPVQQAFIIRVEPPDERTRSMAVIRTVRNAGMSVGLLLSAVVIATGEFKLAFAGTAVSYVALLLAVHLLRGRSPRHVGPPEHERVPGTVLSDRRYLLLAVGNAVLTLHDSVLFTLLPLWLVTMTTAPDWLVGPLLAVNTVLTVLLQVPLTRWAVRIEAARRTLARSLIPLVGACMLFLSAEPAAPAPAAGLAAAAVLMLTVGENLHSVAAFELAHRLAPDQHTGAYLGMFNLSMSAQLAFGPPFMTLVVLRGPAGWFALGGAFVLGGLLMLSGSTSRRKRWVSTSS